MDEPVSKPPRYLNVSLIVVTLIYVPLFLLVGYTVLLALLMLDVGRIVFTLEGLLMTIEFCALPLSFLVALYLMWSRYLRHQYRRIPLYYLIPPLTAMVVFALFYFQF